MWRHLHAKLSRRSANVQPVDKAVPPNSPEPDSKVLVKVHWVQFNLLDCRFKHTSAFVQLNKL